MHLWEYQESSEKTMIPPANLPGHVMWSLGLAGETGEVLEKIKKIHRDKGGVVSAKDRDSLKKELGDVLWYLSALAGSLDLCMNDVAHTNLIKLNLRVLENKIQGEGDER